MSIYEYFKRIEDNAKKGVSLRNRIFSQFQSKFESRKSFMQFLQLFMGGSQLQ